MILARRVEQVHGCLPKLTVTLKYLVVSTTCFERDNEPVRKLRTEPAPFACKESKEGKTDYKLFQKI